MHENEIYIIYSIAPSLYPWKRGIKRNILFIYLWSLYAYLHRWKNMNTKKHLIEYIKKIRHSFNSKLIRINLKEYKQSVLSLWGTEKNMIIMLGI